MDHMGEPLKLINTTDQHDNRMLFMDDGDQVGTEAGTLNVNRTHHATGSVSRIIVYCLLNVLTNAQGCRAPHPELSHVTAATATGRAYSSEIRHPSHANAVARERI